MNLENRHIIVTGAGAGIGLGVARQCVAAGATVTGMDWKTDGKDQLTRLGAHFMQVDVMKPEQFQEAVVIAHDRVGRLDGMVNNAGTTIKRDFLEMSVEDMDMLWEVNQRSVLVGTQAAARLMVGKGGSIVNLASVHATTSNPGHEAYAGTKGAIKAMTRSMAWSLGPRGVRVNTLSPAMTQTEIVIDAMKDPENAETFRSWGADHDVSTVDEIGAAAVFLLSNAASALNGTDLVADRAMTALLWPQLEKAG